MYRLPVTVACLALALTACTPPEGKVSAGDATTIAPGAGSPAKTATWGQKYEWEDGTSIELSQPTECVAGKFALPQKINRAVRFTATIRNGSGKALEVSMFMLATQATLDSARAEPVLDTNGPCGNHLANQGTVQPGKTYKATLAYAVAKAPGELVVTFKPDLTTAPAVFTGQV